MVIYPCFACSLGDVFVCVISGCQYCTQFLVCSLVHEFPCAWERKFPLVRHIRIPQDWLDQEIPDSKTTYQKMCTILLGDIVDT
jgi:hypothetical protein